MIGDRAATDVGERFEGDGFFLDELFNDIIRIPLFAAENELEIIKNRPHPVGKFFILTAGQVTNVFAQGDDWSADEKL